MELWNCKFWFNYFLHNRRQCISTGGTKSDDLVITHGVPQGSVLGPLLFRLYVNDFSNCSKLFDFHICADDTNIFYANRSLSELEVAINNLIAPLLKPTNYIVKLVICNSQRDKTRKVN